MFSAMRRLQDDVGELAEANFWSLSTEDIGEVLDEVSAVQARLAAVKLAVVAEADGRDIGMSEATTTAGWLRGRLLLGPGEAKRIVKLADALRDGCPATGAALGRGLLSVEHARVIVQAMAGLPAGEPPVEVQAEQSLRRLGRGPSHCSLGRRGRHDSEQSGPALPGASQRGTPPRLGRHP